MDELEARVGRQPLDAGAFEAHVVIGVEVVEPDDDVSASEQAGVDVKADEPGGAGDENLHAGVPRRSVVPASDATPEPIPPAGHVFREVPTRCRPTLT